MIRQALSRGFENRTVISFRSMWVSIRWARNAADRGGGLCPRALLIWPTGERKIPERSRAIPPTSPRRWSVECAAAIVTVQTGTEAAEERARGVFRVFQPDPQPRQTSIAGRKPASRTAHRLKYVTAHQTAPGLSDRRCSSTALSSGSASRRFVGRQKLFGHLGEEIERAGAGEIVDHGELRLDQFAGVDIDEFAILSLVVGHSDLRRRSKPDPKPLFGRLARRATPAVCRDRG